MSTDLIALTISALTLVWTVVWSIWLYRRTVRPRSFLHVSGALGITGMGGVTSGAGLFVTVVNRGTVPTTLTAIDIGVRGDDRLIMPLGWLSQDPAPMPLVLQPGRHWKGFFELTHLEPALNANFASRRKTRGWKLRLIAHGPAGDKHEGAFFLRIT